jgi:hypothetical protein
MQAGQAQQARRHHQGVVLLNHIAVLVAPVVAVFPQPFRQRVEDLQPLGGEPRLQLLDGGVLIGIGLEHVELHGQQPLNDAVALFFRPAPRQWIDHARHPFAAVADGCGMDGQILPARHILRAEIDRIRALL